MNLGFSAGQPPAATGRADPIMMMMMMMMMMKESDCDGGGSDCDGEAQIPHQYL